MVYNVNPKTKKVKPEIGDTRTIRKFLIFPVPNVFGDKRAWFERSNVVQVYEEYEQGFYRWTSKYFIEEPLKN